MSLEELYAIFRGWLDPDKFGYHLKPDAPEEAKKALEEYYRIKTDSKGKIVD